MTSGPEPRRSELSELGGRLSTIDDNGLPRQKRRLAGQKHYGIGDLLRGGCPLNRQARRVDPNAGDPMHSSEPHTRTVSSTLSVIIEAPREAVFKWFVPVALPDILLGYGPLPAASAVIGRIRAGTSS